ncbi:MULTISPECIES: recombinase family protein [Erysipelothrix]|uniref:recombinase family protein n=1 Tax=Erysipelothrix TaxID=1647 RepID=UPI00140A4ED1|nr:recombinase family protein [Erysipelothrix rhusiopathiae]WMT70174.1 recombinase family protein [Erysipelothrix rhusiopathiae]
MKVIANYCRVSTREQAEYGFSLLDQEEKNKSYLELYEDQFPRGIKIVPYIDDGQSARDLNRKELQRLIRDIRQGRIHTVVIHNLDRLTRRIKDLMQLLELFEKYDVQLISIREKVETETAMGRFFISVIILIAQWEQETNSERTKRGMDRSAQEGNYVHGVAPIGYKKVDKRLEIDEVSSEIVKLIYYMYLVDHFSMNSISIYLNSISSLDIKWNAERIKIILSNQIYVGHYENSRIKIEDHSPAIVDAATFEQVQQRLELRNRKATKTYIFKGVCRAYNHSEAVLHRSTNKPNKVYLYYVDPVTGIRFNEDKISELIEEQIDNFISTRIKSSVKQKVNYLSKKDHVVKEAINLYELGLINEDFYKNTIKKLSSEIIDREEQIQLVDRSISKWSTMNRQKKTRFIHTHISEIELDFKNLRIHHIVFKSLDNLKVLNFDSVNYTDLKIPVDRDRSNIE